ncbi:MAG: HipA domain-containing protein [bacterium]|nr:HipA domain-containing protein [bacterium]
MTTSDVRRRPSHAYVWIWLPGADDPVVAGRLTDRGPEVTFTYGQSYLARPNAIALSLPELPLGRGELSPHSGDIAGCVADAGPDAWGRRVIEHRRMIEPGGLSTLGYLLESGSDRIGALDIQPAADGYVPRFGGAAPLEELAGATRRVEEGLPLSDELHRALVHGSSAGGARPKVLVTAGESRYIAKFPSLADADPVVQAEYVAMDLARLAGVAAAPVAITRVARTRVLLVERFDRTPEGHRRLMHSALTLLGLHDADGIAGRYGTYPDFATEIRSRFANPTATLRELFARITFNILVGNTDDHPRNHAAFWDGTALTLTPAYDICPQPRLGGEAAQAMAYGPNGDRLSQVTRCIAHAPTYRLNTAEATAIVDHQIDAIRNEWHAACDRAELTDHQRQRLWGRQFLNPYALYDHTANPNLRRVPEATPRTRRRSRRADGGDEGDRRLLRPW